MIEMLVRPDDLPDATETYRGVENACGVVEIEDRHSGVCADILPEAGRSVVPWHHSG